MEKQPLNKGEQSNRPELYDQSFRLPDYEEMSKRLEGLSGNNVLGQSLIALADCETSGAGLTLQIAELIEATDQPEVGQNILLRHMPEYLQALIDDADIQEATIELWNEKIAALKQEDEELTLPSRLPRKTKKAFYKPVHLRGPREQERIRKFRKNT